MKRTNTTQKTNRTPIKNKEDLIAALLDARRLSAVSGGNEIPCGRCTFDSQDPSH